MKNIAFSSENHSFKANKLKRVILSKISDVSDNNIQTIIDSIDINRQHYIKATRNPRKFLNVVTEENVISVDECIKSNSVAIYGVFKPGVFVDNSGVRSMKEGSIDKEKPAAAIKSIVYRDKNDCEKVKHLLVIYEPQYGF